MSDPIRLDGATARFDLPLLFAGQAQKEVFVNQALAVIELLDDLRDRIWAHYELTLKTSCREDRITRNKLSVSDPPF